MINLTDIFGLEVPQIDKPAVPVVAKPEVDCVDILDSDLPRLPPLDPAGPRSWGPPPLVPLTGLCSPIPDDQRLKIGSKLPAADPSPTEACDRCGSEKHYDLAAGNDTVRRECSRCKRFMGWVQWRGVSQVDREVQRRERIDRLLNTDLRKHIKRASELRFTPAEFERATALALNRFHHVTSSTLTN